MVFDTDTDTDTDTDCDVEINHLIQADMQSFSVRPTLCEGQK